MNLIQVNNSFYNQIRILKINLIQHVELINKPKF
jgi:hypothetical protein